MDYNRHVMIACDSIAKLRKQDVYRVIDWCQESERQGLAVWLVNRRPDLADEVANCLEEVDNG